MLFSVPPRKNCRVTILIDLIKIQRKKTSKNIIIILNHSSCTEGTPEQFWCHIDHSKTLKESRR